MKFIDDNSFKILLVIAVVSAAMIGAILTFLAIKANEPDRPQCAKSPPNAPLNLRINQYLRDYDRGASKKYYVQSGIYKYRYVF